MAFVFWGFIFILQSRQNWESVDSAFCNPFAELEISIPGHLHIVGNSEMNRLVMILGLCLVYQAEKGFHLNRD